MLTKGDTTSSVFMYEANIGGFSLGVDGISLWLLFIVNILISIVLLNAYKNGNLPMAGPTGQLLQINFKRLIKKISLLSNMVFIVLDLFLFFISFEAVLIPMYFLIGYFGGSNKKIKALNLLILYTLAGSLFLLCSIIFIYTVTGSTSYTFLLLNPIQQEYQIPLFIGFMIAFAVKLPALPFHIWLPVVHSESPTGGSVILAGI